MLRQFQYRQTRDEILKQPSLEETKEGLDAHIGDVPIKELDPGVLSARLVSWLHLGKANGGANGKQQQHHHHFSFQEAQAGLTQLYDRIEQSFGSLFDVLEIEATWPRFIPLEEKRRIYRFSSFPLDMDGKPAQFPPHLEAVPKSDEVSPFSIFDKLALLETQGLVESFVPKTPLQGGLQWLLTELNGDIRQAAYQQPCMAAIEEYNRRHRKTGTDIEQGRNIGLLEDWYSDRRFAEQAFTGPDPTSIERVPRDLLDEFVEAAHGEEGCAYWARRLREIDPRQLFVTDARWFREAVGARADEELVTEEEEEEAQDGGARRRWACAAVTLFHLQDNGQLHPVAIVVDYRGSMRESVTIFNSARGALPPDDDARDIPEQEGDWPWRYAKTCAQVSNWIRHEVGAHLTRAHFVEEAIIVATHRAIPMDHVVFQLLEPHWYKTLSLNAAARATLVPSIIKPVLGFSEDQLYSYIKHEFASMDYVASYVPNDLRRRGFPCTLDGLEHPRFKNYAYAKDMLGMWLVIRRYVRSMLLTRYAADVPDTAGADEAQDPEEKERERERERAADAQIAADPHIAAWTEEVRQGAHIASFPTIRTLDDLTDVITMSIHVAAPFHTAVNYLQNFYQAFVPARPPSLSSALPRTLAELRAYGEMDLVRALPVGDQRQWLLAVQVPWLVSFKVSAERNLIAFARTQWGLHRGGAREDEMVREASARLYDDLNALAVEVARVSRGMDRGSVPYTVLDPRSTAVSILI